MLDVDEPDYAALALAAADAVGHLRRMASSDNQALASKAVSLAGMIGGSGGVGVVADAARSRDPLLRIAAAHAASFLPESADAARVVNRLLADSDIGVVKLATRAAGGQGDRTVAAKLKQATVRVTAAQRAATTATAKGASKMAKKATGKSAKTTGKKRSSASSRSSGQGAMPTGAMVNPPKGVKRGPMPTGKMR
jgi:hypothetical protein